MHLSDQELGLLCDGEDLGDRNEFARRHLASCHACTRALDALESEAAMHARDLVLLDHALPRVSVEAVMARARARPRRRAGLIAAGVGFLLFAGAAAAALPGSPVRDYMRRFLVPRRAASVTPSSRVIDAPAPRDVEQSSTGVAFVPSRGAEIRFDATQVDGTLRLSMVEGASIRITHRGGTAAYRVTADGVSVDNTGSTADFELVVPQTVSRVRVRVDTRTVFEREGGSIRTTAPRDSMGVYVIPLYVTSTPGSSR